MNQEDDQEDEVAIRQDVSHNRRGPEEGSGKFCDIVEVAADSPPAGDQEE